MTEWNDFRVGMASHSRCRRGFGADQVAGIEPRLREIQVAAAEVRIRPHRFVEVADRIGGAARYHEDLAEIEMGAIRVGTARDLGLVLARGGVGLASRVADEPEIVMRHRLIRFVFQRVQKTPFGLVVPLHLDVALAELRQKRRTFDVVGDRALQRRLGALELAAPHPDVGELVACFRVARVQRQHPLEAGFGRVVLSVGLVGERQAERGGLVVGIERERLLVRLERLLRPLRLRIHVAEHEVRLDDLSVGRQRPADFCDPFVEASFHRIERRLLHQVVQRDLVLRIAAAPRLQRARADARADVPQRAKPLLDVGVDRPRRGGRRRGCRARDQLLQRLRLNVGATWIHFGDVARLTGIGLGVVELARWCGDEVVASLANGGQLAPAVVMARVPRLGQRDEVQPFTANERQQAASLNRFRNVDAEHLEHRRHHVDDAHLVGDDARGQRGTGHDERDSDGCVVHEEPVLLFAVLAERLAVIAEDDDDRAIEAAVAGEMIEQTAQLQIGCRNLRVVRADHRRRKALADRCGRIVRRMRLVEMHPREERARPILVEPFDGFRHDLAAGPLHRVEADVHAVLAEIEVVEEALEALGDAPSTIEDERGDEPAGAVPSGAHDFCERLLLLAEIEAAVVAHAMRAGEGSGHERRVRRECQRRRRGRLREPDAAGREGVERRRLRRGIPIAADMIRPQRVDGDDEDVESGIAARARDPRSERD